MNTDITFTTPTQNEIDRHITRAHQLRIDALAAMLRAGFARLQGLVAPKARNARASA